MSWIKVEHLLTSPFVSTRTVLIEPVFEVATNIADVRESIFGEFEHVNNLRTCLLLSLGGSLYNNRFVLYTIIHIIIRCDTITQ